MSMLRDLKASYPVKHTLFLRMLGEHFSLLSNDGELLRALASYYAPYVVERLYPHTRCLYLLQGEPLLDNLQLVDVPRAEAGKRIKEAYCDTPEARVVLKRRSGVVIYIRGEAHYLVGDLRSNTDQAVNFVNMAYSKAVLGKGYAMLHASATSLGGKVIAFTSFSGRGKSTMALAMLDRGHDFVTNDRLFVRVEGGRAEAVGVPKKPRVNPGTLLSIPHLSSILSPDDRKRYSAMPQEDLWGVEHKHDVDVDSIYGPDRTVLRGELAAIYVLKWSLSSLGWHVRRMGMVEGRSAIAEVEKDLGVLDPTPVPAAERRQILDGVASTVPMYEVDGHTDASRLARLVHECLGKAGPQATQLAMTE